MSIHDYPVEWLSSLKSTVAVFSVLQREGSAPFFNIDRLDFVSILRPGDLRQGNGENMKKFTLMLALALAATACAKRPDAIVPADIPMAAYTHFDCSQLAQEMIKEQTSLATVSKQQSSAATGDAVGVFLIGVPMSSTFGGDKEGQVAVAKGKVQAIQSAMTSKNCNMPTQPAGGAKKTS